MLNPRNTVGSYILNVTYQTWKIWSRIRDLCPTLPYPGIVGSMKTFFQNRGVFGPSSLCAFPWISRTIRSSRLKPGSKHGLTIKAANVSKLGIGMSLSAPVADRQNFAFCSSSERTTKRVVGGAGLGPGYFMWHKNKFATGEYRGILISLDAVVHD